MELLVQVLLLLMLLLMLLLLTLMSETTRNSQPLTNVSISVFKIICVTRKICRLTVNLLHFSKP